MDKVTPITSKPKATVHEIAAAPDGDLVAFVEDLLARVKSGETIGLAIVEADRARNVSCGWSGGSYHLINSGAARLAHKMAGEP